MRFDCDLLKKKRHDALSRAHSPQHSKFPHEHPVYEGMERLNDTRGFGSLEVKLDCFGGDDFDEFVALR